MTKNIHFDIDGGYQYEAYHNGICFQKSWHRLKYLKALELIGNNTNEKILDAACGSGVLTDLIAQKLNVSITGADFSSKAIEFCKNTYHNANLDFVLVDLQEKCFEQNSFSTIVMLEALEHF